MSLILAIAMLAQPDNINRDPVPDPTQELRRWLADHGVKPEGGPLRTPIRDVPLGRARRPVER